MPYDLRNRIKRSGLGLLPESRRVQMMRQLWNRQNKQSELGYISHLRSGEWDPEEFATVGRRFVDHMVARYHDYGCRPAHDATVLEIGCGVGRFLKPLSEDFAQVIGVDIAEEMVADARKYCEGIANIEVKQTDGTSLVGVADSSVDFVVSAGVFQHITVLSVVGSYLREGLRVLRPGGLLLFQFEGTRTSEIGLDQIGARITAAALDRALSGQAFRIREVSMESQDPVRNVVCTIERTTNADEGGSFKTHPVADRAWLIGAYDGISTDTLMAERLRAPRQTLTFYDE